MNIKSGKWAKKECVGCGEITTNQKFCSNQCQQDYFWEEKKKEIEINGAISAVNTGKRYLVEIRGNKCEICGLEEWQGKNIIMIMDHIDGNSENNYLFNLRLICPNCDSQLPTYKNRNKGNGRKDRREIYARGKK